MNSVNELIKDQAPGKPILVTGAHRSGTTWVGKMLAANGKVAYIREPLNVIHHPGVMRKPIDRWYTYICKDNEAEFLPALNETLALDYHFWSEIQRLRSLKNVLRMLEDSSSFIRGKIFDQKILLKDPFAVFSARWFAERLGCQVVFVVRHPAAFVSSLVRLNWPFDLTDLLEQPLLMRDWLEPFRAELERSVLDRMGMITQASLLWKAIYTVVDLICAKNSGMILVRHEDLSLNPELGFRQLYLNLGLEFTPKAIHVIRDSSAERNPKQISRRAIHSTRLDSRANLSNWKHRLEPSDVHQIRVVTDSVASRYYSPEDWE